MIAIPPRGGTKLTVAGTVPEYSIQKVESKSLDSLLIFPMLRIVKNQNSSRR
jgi:hypothetical protein